MGHAWRLAGLGPLSTVRAACAGGGACCGALWQAWAQSGVADGQLSAQQGQGLTSCAPAGLWGCLQPSDVHGLTSWLARVKAP